MIKLREMHMTMTMTMAAVIKPLREDLSETEVKGLINFLFILNFVIECEKVSIFCLTKSILHVKDTVKILKLFKVHSTVFIKRHFS